MITLLFISEGPTDLGLSFYDEEETEQGGAIVTIVKRTLENILKRNIVFKTRTKPISRLNDWKGKKEKKSIQGYERKVLFTAEHIAYTKECNGIIFVVDQDGDSDRIHHLQNGRKKAAQNLELQHIKMAVGVAIITIEAWLLADPKALAKGLSIPIPDMPPNPEKSKNPKQRIRKLYDNDLDTVSKFQAIAETIDIEILKKRCPKGFEPFYQEIKKEISPLFSK